MDDLNIACTLKDPTLIQFFAAWNKARNGSGLPQRSDIRLQDFYKFAPNTVIFEQHGVRDIRLRLIGNDVADRIQLRKQSTNLFDFFDESGAVYASEFWSALFNVPCGGLTEYSMIYQTGCHKPATTLALPIAGKNGEHFMLGLNRVGPAYRQSERRDAVLAGSDFTENRYLDVGFGTPENRKGQIFGIKKPEEIANGILNSRFLGRRPKIRAGLQGL